MLEDMSKDALFYNYYAQWIEVYKKDAIREATMAKYRMTQKWVEKLAPELKVCELTRTAYQKILNDYAKEHERQTTLDFHHQLKGAVMDAVDEGLIERDPTRKAIIKGKTPREKKIKYLNQFELHTLIADLDIKEEPNWDWFILLVAKTGMRFSEALAITPKLNKAKEQVPQDLEYVKSLVAQMDEVVEKINHQNERYDALNKKLSEIETSKDDEEVRERLVKENQDKDALINSQQNELNKASSTIARLRDDIEKKDKEIKRMGDRIESLEDKIISVATENKKEAESKAEPQESQSVPQAEKKMVDTVAVPQNMQAVANGIPVYYQIPVVDGTGNVVQRLPIE